jgi:triacylglycerol lipase
LTSYLLNIFDSPAYSNLTTSFLRDHFNSSQPDDPSVKYTSVAGRISKMSVFHPLWFPKLVLDAAGESGYAEDADPRNTDSEGKRIYEGNDGLVSVSSAKWGEFIGVVDDCHHWDLRGEGGLLPNGGLIDDKEKKKEFDSALGEHLGLAADAKDLEEKTKSDARKLEKAVNERKSSTWDIAQVGQVLDWVMDLIPGVKGSETGKKQIADAKKEKFEKKKESGFDLARFYGGLMLKLREDGF